MRSSLRFVVLNVPIGGGECLPDPVQVGMAVGRTGRLVRSELPSAGGLTDRGHRGPPEDGDHGGRCSGNRHASQSVTHLKPLLDAGVLPSVFTSTLRLMQVEIKQNLDAETRRDLA